MAELVGESVMVVETNNNSHSRISHGLQETRPSTVRARSASPGAGRISTFGRQGGIKALTEAEKHPSWRSRTITLCWAEGATEQNGANPAYSYTNEPNESDIINMTSKERRPKVRNTIAQFESLFREHQEAQHVLSGNKRTVVIERDERQNMSVYTPAKPSVEMISPHSEQMAVVEFSDSVLNGVGNSESRTEVTTSSSPQIGDGEDVRVIEIARL